MKAQRNKRNTSVRQDLTWLKRTGTVNLRYDLLFAVCMASTFTGLVFLIIK
jgi:hypothetical protein